MVTSRHRERLEKVVHALRVSGSKSVLDLGCGPGELMSLLAAENRFTKIAGVDTSLEVLAEAGRRLASEERYRRKVHLSLHHASFTVLLGELTDFDAVVMVETIEHVEPRRLSAVERTVFAGYRPKTVLITTPNREYNVLHGVPEGGFRHRDHRFEWPRGKFRKWSAGVAKRHGYRITFDDIGDVDPELGSSTQMATFSRRDGGERQQPNGDAKG